jgi:proline iminopeptidase
MKTFHFFTMLILFGVILLYGCENDTDSPPDYPVRETGTVLSNGIKLEYFIEGKGYPCIVNGDMSAMISKELKSKFKFIFLKQRAGMVDPGNVDSITFDVLAEDIEQVRIAVKLDKVGVFGHSMWGLIPLEYARRYPTHTAFVIMNGTPPYVNDKLWSIQDSYWMNNASAERKNAYYEKWKGISSNALNALGTSDAGKYSYILSAAWYFYDFNFDMTPYLKDAYWGNKLGSHMFNVLLPGYDIKQDKPVEAPVFLALGKYDFSVPYIIWNDQKEKIPNLTVNLFELSGHYPFFEEEELYRTKLITWVENTVIW